MAAYITVGAKTTHGGEVITGSPHSTHNGISISRKGDKVICRKCKKLTTILSGDPSFIVDGAPIARAGDVTSCGAKLIAVQQSFCESDFEVGGVEQPAPLVFPKSAPEALFAAINKDKLTPTKIQLLNEKTQEPLDSVKYTLTFKDGSVEAGLTDSNGYTLEFNNKDQEIVNVEYPNFKEFGNLIKNYI
ncbi:PAAR domain-containing protein [Psychrobacter celer]|uniref:PAAR domain-containing protein n=1 Tax=Psychrobacter celer TaxID=306572 RepID=UPI003FD51796